MPATSSACPTMATCRSATAFPKVKCCSSPASRISLPTFSVRIRNPLKIKQLHKGLQQLGEEGAVQVFKPLHSADLVLGAVGVLQFEVVASRLMNEYGVDAVFEGTSISSARWISCDDKKMLADFEKSSAGHNLATDAGGNLAYLATSGVNLKLTQERWPGVTFHSTREHAVKVG